MKSKKTNVPEDGMTTLIELLKKITIRNKEHFTSYNKTDWNYLITHTKEYKRFDKIKLSAVNENTLSSIFDRRKSQRQFSSKYKVDIETLGQIFANIKDKGIEGYPKKSFPSAGALYPSNTYCLVNRGLDISKGLYYYNPKTNELEILVDKDLQDEINEIVCDNQIGAASVFFVLTNSYFKSCLKYGARGFLYSMIEIGALAQIINLSCIQNDLECVWVGGFVDTLLAELLDINSDLEIERPVLIIAAGKSKKTNK
ncbi:MAG: SagB/ThcOx family dehydrogenase [Verrucomicrobia bacterium]|nr:SagB/ThcOx family dehydrogenase [Verrucomicrobiota bacterium]